MLFHLLRHHKRRTRNCIWFSQQQAAVVRLFCNVRRSHLARQAQQFQSNQRSAMHRVTPKYPSVHSSAFAAPVTNTC